MIKTYKGLNRELAITFSSTLYSLEKGRGVPKEMEERQQTASCLRNKIAAETLNNPSCDKILNYFKVDKESLKKQAIGHDMRETVLQFKNQSNFKEKREAALKIAQDIKGHYPFIKELGANTKTLNTMLRIEAREAVINGLSETQKCDYMRVVDYKVASRKATAAWKSVFAAKDAGQIYQEEIKHAQQLTAKRDNLACSLKETTGVESFIEQEKLDYGKIAAQANFHQARLKTINHLNTTKEKLLHQMEQRLTQMNPSEARTWHRGWQELSLNLKRISHSLPLYHHAIEDGKQSPFALTESQKAMLSRYELETELEKTAEYKNTTHSLKQKEYLDAALISEALMANPINTYRSLFGEPKKVTSQEMRYSGGLIVSLKGSKAGFWYDFATGVGGSPIQAIMRERGLSFESALKEGAAMAGLSEWRPTTLPLKENRTNRITEIAEDKNKVISAKSILNGGIPIKGTLAERYLKEHRGIENPDNLHVLFWPKGAMWRATDDSGNLYEKTNKIPALLIAAKNAKGDITGVQRVYLDEKSGGKNTFMDNAKLSKGKIEGSAGLLQKGAKLGALYLVEGPETGASIAMANPKATVLVSFGLSNLKNLAPLIKKFHPNEIIIAGDNDVLSKNNTLKATHEAQESLKAEGVNAKIIIPKNISGREKTDWNDVHRLKGINSVRNELGIMLKSGDDWVIKTVDSISKEELKFINNIDISSYKNRDSARGISSIDSTKHVEKTHHNINQRNMDFEL